MKYIDDCNRKLKPLIRTFNIVALSLWILTFLEIIKLLPYLSEQAFSY